MIHCHRCDRTEGVRCCEDCGLSNCDIHAAWLTVSPQRLDEKIWICNSCMDCDDEEPLLMSDEQVKRLGGTATNDA